MAMVLLHSRLPDEGHGRIWHSPAGVLTASFILGQIPVVHLPGFSLAAGLAVIYAIEELLPDWQGMLRLSGLMMSS
jgi:BirA family biotin operon repressor/biotin-[acetyl-CoA-carboxylase] ligase